MQQNEFMINMFWPLAVKHLTMISFVSLKFNALLTTCSLWLKLSIDYFEFIRRYWNVFFSVVKNSLLCLSFKKEQNLIRGSRRTIKKRWEGLSVRHTKKIVVSKFYTFLVWSVNFTLKKKLWQKHKHFCLVTFRIGTTPLLRIGHNSVRMAKISFFFK